MALKNLFDMAKTDRYTADGREALIKAQEAETEDKVYQIGEISQKTGLQKTANGWVKPKSGKQPAVKQEEPKNVHGAEVDKIYERQLKRIKELKAKGFTDEQIDNDKIIKQTKEDMKNVGNKPESKPGRDRPALKKEDHVKLAKEVLSNTSATDPGWTAEEIAKEWKLGEADAEEVKKEFDNLRKGSSESKPAAGSKKGQVLNTFKTGNAGGSKWDVNITGGENDLANEFFEQHGARFNFRGKDVNVDDYIKPIDKNSFELKLWNSGNESKGYYGKLVGKGNNTDMRYIVTKTPSGWDLKKTERRYYGMPNSEKNYKLDNNKYTRTQDSAPRVLTGDTRIRVRKA